MSDFVEVITADSSSGVVSADDQQLDLFFKMHERINAKSEEITKSYSNNILVKIDDIKELHYKTMQSIHSLNPAMSAVGIRIAVSHNEGESEKFNSFEEFSNHNKTSPNPTSNILMTYTFTIHNTDTDTDTDSGTYENYKISNMIRSRVAELNKFEQEAPGFIPSALIASLVTTTAKITIEYSDYVKARHFTAMFDEWIRGCDESKSLGAITHLKKVSQHIHSFGLITIYALIAYFTASAINEKLINSDLVIQFAVIYASTFLIIRGVCSLLLQKIESSIDGYLAISYLNINKGDIKLINKFSSRNKSSLLWAIGGLLGTILIGVVTSMVYDFIKWFLLQ